MGSTLRIEFQCAAELLLKGQKIRREVHDASKEFKDNQGPAQAPLYAPNNTITFHIHITPIPLFLPQVHHALRLRNMAIPDIAAITRVHHAVRVDMDRGIMGGKSGKREAGSGRLRNLRLVCGNQHPAREVGGQQQQWTIPKRRDKGTDAPNKAKQDVAWTQCEIREMIEEPNEKV